MKSMLSMLSMVSMKKLVLMGVGLLLCGSLYARNPETTQWITVIDSATVNATAVVYSDPIDVSNFEDFGFYVLIHSGSGPSVSAYYQVIPSMQGVTSLVGDATVGEKALVWATPVSASTMTTTLTAGAATDALAPMVTKWVRFGIKGDGSNGANTKASLFISGYSER